MSQSMIINGIKYIPISDFVYTPISDIGNSPNSAKDGLEYCIIRTYAAGVWAGWIDTKNKDSTKEVFEARRLWKWWSEFTLSALAIEGQKKGKETENKYAMPVPRVILHRIEEEIPCTEKAKEQIINTPNYSE